MGALDYKTRRHRRNRLAAELYATYHPSRDFRQGEPGVVLVAPTVAENAINPTLFQDSAGTTPVTAPEQPVGLWLDVKGGVGVRGRERWSDDAVTFAGESSRVSPGVYRVYTSAGVYTLAGITSSMTIGRTYETTFTVDSVTVAGSGVTLEGASVGSWTTTGAKRMIFTATGTGFGFKRSAAVATDIQVSNISIREIPGNHATQSSAGARPTYTQRVNLLTSSDAPTWALLNLGTGTAPVVTNNAGTSPRGTGNAQRLQCNRGGGTASGDYSAVQLSISGSIVGARYKSGIYLKSNTGSTQNVMFYINTGASADVQVVSVGAEWQLVPSAIHTATSTTIGAVTLGTRGGTPGPTTPAGGDDVLDLLVWGADLRTADNAAKQIPAYQHVTTASDYDTEGFPPRVVGNGTSHWMSLPLDMSSTDKVCVVAGVTINTTGMICELGPLTDTTNGSFAFYLPANQIGVYVRGTTSMFYRAASHTYPKSAIASAFAGTSPQTAELILNGVTQSGGTSGATSAGALSNSTLYLFSRAGTSLFLNGGISSLVIRGGSIAESARNNIERWAKNLAKLVY